VPIPDEARGHTIARGHGKPGGRGIERERGVRDTKDGLRGKGKLLAAHLRSGVRRGDLRGIIATTTTQQHEGTAEHEDRYQAEQESVRPLHAFLSFWGHGMTWPVTSTIKWHKLP